MTAEEAENNNAAGYDAKGLLCDMFDEKTVFVNMRKTGVHRSRDGGYTWEQIIADTDQTQDLGRSSTIVQDDSGNAQVLCYDNEERNIIYSSYHNSYDNGKTWIRNRYFLIDVHPENTKIQAP